jgi:hypothetical protein
MLFFEVGVVGVFASLVARRSSLVARRSSLVARRSLKTSPGNRTRFSPQSLCACNTIDETTRSS